MKKHTLKVSSRDLQSKLKSVRQQNLVPGNVFGSKIDSTPVQVETKALRKAYGQVGESGVLYLQLDKKEIPAMVEEVQFEPVSDDYLHVSFLAVDLTEKISSEIPVELVGKFEVPEAVLVTVRDEIEVEALPTDLPEKFVIDVEKLTEIGQSITLADLEYDREKVEIIVGEEGIEAPVVLVQEVEEEPEEEEEIETTIIGEEEGAEVEGEAAPAQEAKPEEAASQEKEAVEE
ncbi:MAG: 50S ribosomal protein L25 [Candidatus Pacebacteria bacterium]|nr:50S ribosomal protein L25 [Candidatus Paceibacterota bacterium]